MKRRYERQEQREAVNLSHNPFATAVSLEVNRFHVSTRLLPFPLSPAPFGPSLLTSFGPFGSGSAGNGMGGEEP